MKIKANKKLGQNFLIDKNIIQKVVDAGNIKENDIVLEIGPGTGNLTEYILKKKPKKFFVVEKDNNLFNLLNKKFNKKIEIINNDVLNINFNNIKYNQIIVFGNLPYNISTQILTQLIIDYNLIKKFKKFIFMFQKEVAERILAETNTKNYGRLSIIANWKLNIKKELSINPQCFYPRPKIDSTLLSFVPKKNYLDINNPKNLEHITRIFFNQRRKMIKNPLKQIFKKPDIIAKNFNLNINHRPQNLNLLTYLKLTKEFEKLNS